MARAREKTRKRMERTAKRTPLARTAFDPRFGRSLERMHVLTLGCSMIYLLIPALFSLLSLPLFLRQDARLHISCSCSKDSLSLSGSRICCLRLHAKESTEKARPPSTLAALLLRRRGRKTDSAVATSSLCHFHSLVHSYRAAAVSGLLIDSLILSSPLSCAQVLAAGRCVLECLQ